MSTKSHPNGTRTIASGVRKLLTLGHSRGITLPASWLRNNTFKSTAYLSYTIHADGSLVIERAPGVDRAP